MASEIGMVLVSEKTTLARKMRSLIWGTRSAVEKRPTLARATTRSRTWATIKFWSHVIRRAPRLFVYANAANLQRQAARDVELVGEIAPFAP